MKPSSTFESKRLATSNGLIEEIASQEPARRNEARFQLLEAVAALLGGFAVEDFHKQFGIAPIWGNDQHSLGARMIIKSIAETGIHPTLCLSALARETLDGLSQRTKGVYHTDFRLAQYLAQNIGVPLKPGIRVVDPACGAGMLLAAVSIIACGSDRSLAADWLSEGVNAADLSRDALRGTLLTLASLTNDLEALKVMRGRWREQDSLLATDEKWRELAPDGFDLVVANPPWEKVKLTRHEHIKASGEHRHYGMSYENQPLLGYEAARFEKAKLASALCERYPSVARGEPDLYVAFTELLLKLTRADGCGCVIVPAGLIRSLRTRELRMGLIRSTRKLACTVMDNRARHFAIDTRFKFLLIRFAKGSGKTNGAAYVDLAHATANGEEISASPAVKLPVDMLAKLRPDLTLPEVRTETEWELFRKMQECGTPLDSPGSPWYPSFCREVDMTRGREHFVKSPHPGYLAVIEGRMVQPHRVGCKSFWCGEGRSAKWRNLPPGTSSVEPQFWMPARELPAQTQMRINRKRVGFCDITGQTNERSMIGGADTGTCCLWEQSSDYRIPQ